MFVRTLPEIAMVMVFLAAGMLTTEPTQLVDDCVRLACLDELQCSFGFQRDEYGCETCSCELDPDHLESYPRAREDSSDDMSDSSGESSVEYTNELNHDHANEPKDEYANRLREEYDRLSEYMNVERELYGDGLDNELEYLDELADDDYRDDEFLDVEYLDDDLSDEDYLDDEFTDVEYLDDVFSDEEYFDDPFSDEEYLDDEFLDDDYIDDEFTDDGYLDDAFSDEDYLGDFSEEYEYSDDYSDEYRDAYSDEYYDNDYLDDDRCPLFLECPHRCLHGYRKDDFGCATCHCKKNPRAEEECSRLSKETCGWNCDLFGYEMDAEGCETCECDWRTEGRCPVAQCETVCPFGYQRNMLGCETCECVDFSRCDSALMSGFCEWPRCEFGYKHDAVGCPHCECAENPCENHVCEGEEECISELRGNVSVALCKPLQTGIKLATHHVCSPITCALLCEYGNMVDEYGCEICRCRDELRCPVLQCEKCEFGYSYNKDGCRSCQCMEDPCMGLRCDRGYVCESHINTECSECTVVPRCILFNDVISASVKIDYDFPTTTSISHADTFLMEQEFRKNLLESMELSKENINKLQLSLPTSEHHVQTVHVSFCLTRAHGYDADIVMAYRRFLIINHPEIEFGNTYMFPNTRSARVHFSGAQVEPTSLPTSTAATSSRNWTSFVIVMVAMCGIAIILTVLLVWTSRFRSRTRYNSIYRPGNNKDSIYGHALLTQSIESESTRPVLAPLLNNIRASSNV